MLRGLWSLTWLEFKIFLREPLGAIGTVGVPILFVLLGQRFGGGPVAPGRVADAGFLRVGLPVLVAVLVAVSGVLSLVTIVSIYREGGILKRLRATPLRPHTILAAHVLVKLLLTVVTLVAMMLAGRRYIPTDVHVPVAGFAAALVMSSLSVLSVGFVIASVVPTARFAQPVGALIFYPMMAISGLFVPVGMLPPLLRAVARLMPLTYAVSLLQGIWVGEAWSAHAGDMIALAVIAAASLAVSARIFRWE